MPDAIALIPTRLVTTALGLPSLVAHKIGGRTVLEHTVARVARVPSVRKIVLLHGEGQDPMALLSGRDFPKPICCHADPQGLEDLYTQKHAIARKWALGAWRGGLGGAMCYDELLPAGPMLAAMQEHKAQSALVIGADWLLVDPDYCRQVLELHLEHPEDMQMTFTQAPPGLCGVAVGRELISQFAQGHAGFGQTIAYNPAKPQADPIGRDVCKQIPASIRSCGKRLIYDTPAAAARIRWMADQLADRFGEASAQVIAELVSGVDDQTASRFAKLPQMITLELTPRRLVTGPIVPQHYVNLDRPDMALDTALRIVSQMGEGRDIALTLGGLGDALLHPQWEQIVIAVREAGVLGLAVETDLLVDQPVLEKLLELPIDVVSVRLNADTAALYKKVMGPISDGVDDGFAKVLKNLEWLFNTRNGRTRELLGSPSSSPTGRGAGVPWIVTRLVKTKETLDDLETFFDRWVYYAGHAVIEPATSGCGLGPDLSPVCMAPPRRFGCRQVRQRMTIHSDGRVARCDQDWLGRASAGDAATTPLVDIWDSMCSIRESHEEGRWDDLDLCGTCHEWHRP